MTAREVIEEYADKVLNNAEELATKADKLLDDNDCYNAIKREYSTSRVCLRDEYRRIQTSLLKVMFYVKRTKDSAERLKIALNDAEAVRHCSE